MRHALLALALFASSAPAQVPVDAGARVRLVRSEKHEPLRIGKVVSPGSDSLLVDFEPVPEWELRGDRLSVPRSQLEVLVATRRRTRMGAVIGAIAGTFSGFQAGSTAFGDLCEGGRLAPQCRKDDSMAVPLAVVGALVGAGTGATVGWMIKSETWAPVPAGRSLGLALHLNLR